MKKFQNKLFKALSALQLIPLFVVCTLAATTISGLDDSDIVASYESSSTRSTAEWTADGTTLTGMATGYSRLGSKSNTATLTLKNGKGQEAILSFSIDVSAINGGTLTVAGTTVSSNQSYSTTLASGDSITIALQSPKGRNNTGTVTLTGVTLAVEGATSTITFLSPSGGSYTVDGAQITADTKVEKEQTESYTMAATVSSGYKFVGWYDVTNGRYLSADLSYTSLFSSDITIQPVFVSNDTAIFQVGTQKFTDLNKANNYAVSSGETTIILISSGTVASGNYTISTGKILLIPCDSAYTLYTSSPSISSSHTTPYAYMTLTLPKDTSITVNGAISLASQVSAAGQNSGSWNGTPTGPYGRIHMETGSSITLESGAYLYTHGYISGDGTVLAKPGATVYEWLQLRSWRGGTAIAGSAANLLFNELNPVFTDNKIFPTNQYYIQNIEVALTLESGATEMIWAAANASSFTPSTSATFMGTGGLFTLASGTTLTKRYDAETDRLYMELEGDATFSSFKLAFDAGVAKITLDTSAYVLTLGSNMTVNVHSGTATVKQDLALLPGTVVTVDEGATVDLTNQYNTYVYDKDEWGNYAISGGKLSVVGYSTDNGTKTMRTEADLVDAVFDVNGTVLTNGNLYTTKSGASIISSGKSGVVKFITDAGIETATYQATQSGTTMTKVDIEIVSAQLQNIDKEYVSTTSASAKDVYNNVDGYWHYNTEVHTYNENGICTQCGLSAVAAIISDDGTGYFSSLSAACEAFTTDDLYIQMLTGTTEPGFTIGKNIYLDLNGQDVEISEGKLTISDGCTLYGMDSTTDAYGLDVTSGTYTPGTITGTVTGTVSGHYSHTLGTGSARHYAAYKNGNTYSFHRFRFGMDSYTYYLSPEKEVLAITFSATYLGDANAKSAMAGFGMEVNDVDSGYLEKGATGLDSVTGTNGASGYVLKRTVTDPESGDVYNVSALLKLADNTELESVGYVASVTVSELGG